MPLNPEKHRIHRDRSTYGHAPVSVTMGSSPKTREVLVRDQTKRFQRIELIVKFTQFAGQVVHHLVYTSR